jgi:GDPmannose 4,6-dehydratase
LSDKIVLGNLESRRDWGRAQDCVQAMWMMLQAEKPDDYVVATGKAHSVDEFVKEAFTVVRLEAAKHVVYDKTFDRPADPSGLVGSAEKIQRTLGWQPTGDFKTLVREMVEAELTAIDLDVRSDSSRITNN